MIDLNPAVGRIVIRHSDHPDEYIDPQWIGPITAVNGQRVQFVQTSNGASISRFMLMKTVRAVCDTQEEVEKIKQFAKDFNDSITQLRTAAAGSWEELKKG